MTTSAQHNYFCRAELWASEAVAEQLAVADDLLGLIPETVHSILDAGCGNGVVTNRLVGRWDVVGCDLSVAALRQVRAPTVAADLSSLPFSDRHFDLVMASDVLEHLPAQIYRQALAEIGRVASRYILVAVPYREVLEAARIICPHCANSYHAHLHQRSYGVDDVADLFGADFGAVAVRFSGERWLFADRQLVEAAGQVSHLDYPFEEGVCPQCNRTRGHVARAESARKIARRFEALQAMQVAEGLSDMPPRSEMLVLFERGAPVRHDWLPPEPPAVYRTSVIELAGLAIKQDPINYPCTPYQVGSEPDFALIAIPCRPSALQATKGTLLACEVYNHVAECYLACLPDDQGRFAVPDVPFGPRGCLLRLAGASADLQLGLSFRDSGYIEIAAQCMADDPIKAPQPACQSQADVLPAQAADIEQRYLMLSEQVAGQARVMYEQRMMIGELKASLARLRAGQGGNAVLVVSHMYPDAQNPVGGIFVHEQVKALRALGLDARVVSGVPLWVNVLNPLRVAAALRAYRATALDEWEDYQGVPIIRFPYVVSNVMPFQGHAMSYCHGLMRHAEQLRARFGFELIHAHTAYTDGSAAARLASRCRVPLVVTEHTGPFSTLTRTPYLRRTTQRSMNAASRLIAVSSALLNEIRARVTLHSNVVTQVIPNLVDTRFFRVATKPDSDLIQMLWVGHFVAVKRVPVLLQAFADARKAEPRLRLTLVGDGEGETAAKAFAQELGVGDYVFFNGRADRFALREHYRLCDFLVIASHTETFGVVAIEAMSCGRPVLSTRCGGPEDVITEPGLGRLVGLGTAELAEGMLDMAEQSKQFNSQAIAHHADACFSAVHVALKLLRVYRDVLAGDRAKTNL